MMRTKWTEEKAIQWLRERGAQQGRTPTTEDMRPHHMSFVRLFGSVAKAQKAAGFKPNRPGGKKEAT